MSRITARRGIAALAAAVVAVATLTACGGGGGGSAKDGQLIVATNATTYTQNYNYLAPTNTASPPGQDLVYEELISISPTDGWIPNPWLADSWVWNDDGTELTFTLHPGVKWSDGEPFTATDVKFTLEMSLENPTLSQAGVGKITSVDAPDDLTVVVHYAVPSFANFNGYYSVHIYPEHIWKDVDPLTYVPKEPVGTGPFTLERFAPQQVTYAVNPDYWNGESKGVKAVVYRAIASPDTILQELLSGGVDYAESTLVGNPLTDFVAKNPETNHFWLPAPGAGNALLMNNAVEPTSNVHIRQALNSAIDRSELIKLAPATSATASNISGVNEPMYTDWVAPEFRGVLTDIDVENAKAELALSGYTVEGGVLTRDGKGYPLELITLPSDPWGPAIKQSFKEVLGIDVSITPSADATNAAKMGDYILMTPGPDTPGQGVPPGIAWNVDKPVPVGESANLNWARFDSPEAQALAAQLSTTNDPEVQKELVYEIERIIVAERPTAPLTPYVWSIAYTSRHWTNWPDQDNPASVPSNGRGDVIRTILALTPAK